jgi:hypothetical protein
MNIHLLDLIRITIPGFEVFGRMGSDLDEVKTQLVKHLEKPLWEFGGRI